MKFTFGYEFLNRRYVWRQMSEVGAVVRRYGSLVYTPSNLHQAIVPFSVSVVPHSDVSRRVIVQESVIDAAAKKGRLAIPSIRCTCANFCNSYYDRVYCNCGLLRREHRRIWEAALYQALLVWMNYLPYSKKNVP